MTNVVSGDHVMYHVMCHVTCQVTDHVMKHVTVHVTIHRPIFPFCPPLDHPVHSLQYRSLSL